MPYQMTELQRKYFNNLPKTGKLSACRDRKSLPIY